MSVSSHISSCSTMSCRGFGIMMVGGDCIYNNPELIYLTIVIGVRVLRMPFLCVILTHAVSRVLSLIQFNTICYETIL